jgi:hypothetical protein
MPPRTVRLFALLCGSVGCLVVWTLPAHARPAHKKALADYMGPFLAKKLNDCRTCHVPDKPGAVADDENKPHNPFGARLKAVRTELKKADKKADLAACLDAILDEDSDGDGVSNLIELLSGHLPAIQPISRRKRRSSRRRNNARPFSSFASRIRGGRLKRCRNLQCRR